MAGTDPALSSPVTGEEGLESVRNPTRISKGFLSACSPSPSQSRRLCSSRDFQAEPGVQRLLWSFPCSRDALQLRAGSRPAQCRFLMRRRIGLWPLRSHYKVPCFS